LALLISIGTTCAYAEENASNPLAAVSNTDLRAQYFDLDGPERRDYYVDGASMLTPNLKLKYELHYWDTDVTGSSENDWESLNLKPIYFPETMVGKLGSWKYKVAIGGELILDAGNEDKGIGSGSDQVAPLFGLAFVRDNTVLVPIVQHFVEYDGPDVNTTSFRLIAIQSFENNVEYDGPDVNTTSFRLIAIQSFENNFWGKLDAKVPVDWENDNEIASSIEVQLGKMFTPAFGTYVDGLFGVGGDKPYDWGVGVGVRFNY
jgi:hypothetical protein